MARFHYTVIAPDIDPGVDDTFTSDLEYFVGDVVWLGPTNYVVEKVEDASIAHWRENSGSPEILKRLHCRRSADAA